MFFKEVNEIDLGETTIANIFIDIFMPMANGLYVKVYLLGYRQACDPNSNPKFDNNSIAKNLNIPLSDVIDAWKFWQNKNIIRMHKNEGLDDFDYSIEFLDLKKFYMDIMHINTKSIKSNSDSIVSASENPSVRKMFTTIKGLLWLRSAFSSRGLLWLRSAFSSRGLLWLRSLGSGPGGSVVPHTGLVAPLPVGSSWIRD